MRQPLYPKQPNKSTYLNAHFSSNFLASLLFYYLMHDYFILFIYFSSNSITNPMQDSWFPQRQVPYRWTFTDTNLESTIWSHLGQSKGPERTRRSWAARCCQCFWCSFITLYWPVTWREISRSQDFRKIQVRMFSLSSSGHPKLS